MLEACCFSFDLTRERPIRSRLPLNRAPASERQKWVANHVDRERPPSAATRHLPAARTKTRPRLSFPACPDERTRAPRLDPTILGIFRTPTSLSELYDQEIAMKSNRKSSKGNGQSA